LSDDGLADEETALADAKRGQATAFAVLVRAHQASVFSVALRMLGDREQARDLAQEVFLQLYRKLSSIESARHLKFWLRKVAANLSIDRLRQQPKVEFTVLDESFELPDTGNDEDALLPQQLLQFVYELPNGPRAVMLLKYQEDLDPTEIAAALEMSINTVKSHLRRSLLTLRERALRAAPERSARQPL
jgi:RNA polymerase sigma-70 factor, ECF subfamily